MGLLNQRVIQRNGRESAMQQASYDEEVQAGED